MEKSDQKEKTSLTTASSTIATLQRAKSLLKLTNDVLEENRQIAESVVWLDELISWADSAGIPNRGSRDPTELEVFLDPLYPDHQFDGFPRERQTILSMQTLYLCSNNILKLPESIGNLTNLRCLILNENKHLELPKSISNLSNLRSLDLNYNKLIEIPVCIENLGSLESLNLGINRISILPEWIGNLTNLKQLNLSYNKLSKLPDTLGDLTNLETLQLHGNPLSILPKSLLELVDLQRLCLSQYQKLPPYLSRLESITDFIE